MNDEDKPYLNSSDYFLRRSQNLKKQARAWRLVAILFGTSALLQLISLALRIYAIYKHSHPLR